jgi:membrane-anchored protein YejM (alkaline phosphatase superfamily)
MVDARGLAQLERHHACHTRRLRGGTALRPAGNAGAVENLVHLHGGSVRTYQRMIHHMDAGIGWVMDALRRGGVAGNSLIVVTSDNGCRRGRRERTALPDD